MSTGVRSVIFDIIGRDNASKAFLSAAASADKAATSIDRALMTFGKRSAALQRSGAMLTRHLTLPIVALGAVAVDQAVKYQKGLNTIQVATDQTNASMAKYSAGLKKIAVETGTSLSDLTDGLYTVAKGGYKGKQALDIVTAAAKGAKAENVDLGIATTALTSIMQSYGKSLGSPVQAENALIRGAGLAKTTYADFAGSLSNVIPLAASLHVKFADVAAAIDTMTQHGETAQRSTENLNNLLTNLSGGNAVAIKAMGQLGLNAMKVSENLGKNGLYGTLKNVLDTLGHSDKNGRIVEQTFYKSALATQSLNKMLGSMTGTLKTNSEALQKGAMGYKDYRTYAQSLGGQQGQMALQFLTAWKTMGGFNELLRQGKGTTLSYATALKNMLGGMTGMRVALMLTGNSLHTFKNDQQQVTDAASKSNSSILGWGKTSKTAAVQLDKMKEQLQVLAVNIGNKLLPVVLELGKDIAGAVKWFANLSQGTQGTIIKIALFAAALGPVLSILGRLGRMVYYVGTALSRLTRPWQAAALTAEQSSLKVEAAQVQEQAAVERAAAAEAEANALKAEAAAEAALTITTSMAGVGSSLAKEQFAAWQAADQFAAAERAKAEAAINSAAQITATEDALAARLAAQNRALAMQQSMAQSAMMSKFNAGMMGLGVGSMAGMMSANSSGLVKGMSILGSAAAGAALGGITGNLPGAVIGGVAGALSAVATQWLSAGDASNKSATEQQKAAERAKAAIEQQKATIDNLTQSILSEGDAIGRATRLNVAQDLQKNGVFALANQTGINTHLVTSAALGNLKAQAKLSQQVNQIIEQSVRKGGLLTDMKGTVASKLKNQLQAEGILLGKAGVNADNVAQAYGKMSMAQRSWSDQARRYDATLLKQTHDGQENIKFIHDHVTALDQELAKGKLTDAQWAKSIKTFIEQGKQYKFNGGLLKAYVAKFADVPKSVVTKLLADPKIAKSAIGDVLRSLANMPKDRKIPIDAIDKATSKINSVKSGLDTILGMHPPVTLSVDDSGAVSVLDEFQTKINGIVDRNYTATVTVVQTTGGGDYVHGNTAAAAHHKHNARGTGNLGSGWFTVGEAGWELGHRQGNKVSIFPHGQSMRMTGLPDKLPGFASGTGSGSKTTTVYNLGGKQYTTLSEFQSAVQAIVQAVAALKAAAHNTHATASEVRSAARALVEAARQQKVAAKLQERLAEQRDKIDQAARERDKVNRELGTPPARRTAWDKLTAARQRFNSAISGTRQSFLGSFDITTAGQDSWGVASASGILAQVRKAAANAKKYGGLLKKLIREGLPKPLVQQLAQAGPAALTEAQALADMTPKQLAQLRGDYKAIGTYGGNLGHDMANTYYKAGVDSAQKLVDGLTARRNHLSKVIRRLGNDMAKELEKGLNIGKFDRHPAHDHSHRVLTSTLHHHRRHHRHGHHDHHAHHGHHGHGGHHGHRASGSAVEQHFHIHGVQDPNAFAQAVARRMAHMVA